MLNIWIGYRTLKMSYIVVVVFSSCIFALCRHFVYFFIETFVLTGTNAKSKLKKVGCEKVLIVEILIRTRLRFILL
jgi:hypothetical protein